MWEARHILWMRMILIHDINDRRVTPRVTRCAEEREAMSSHLERSDLVEWATHEHEHLSKLFDDLRATFNRLATGELSDEAHDEALAQALDDLEGALDDMLEHFNEEEEVYFVAIRQRFPELATAVDELVTAHEQICGRTQRLQRQVATSQRGSGGGAQMSAALIALVNELALEVERHNVQEQAILSQALRRLSPDERIVLMDDKRALG